jgi:hypothetical protein
MQWTQADPAYRFLPDAAYSSPRRAGLYIFSLQNPLAYIDPDGRGVFDNQPSCSAKVEASPLNTAADPAFVTGATPPSHPLLDNPVALGEMQDTVDNLDPVISATLFLALPTGPAGAVLNVVIHGDGPADPTILPTRSPTGGTASEKTPPNPHGAKGKPSTQAQNAAIASDLEADGYTVTGGGGRAPEEYIPGPAGGKKGSTRVDVTATKDGDTVRVQTVDTRADGSPTGRELGAAGRILKYDGETGVFLVPKDQPKKPQ